MPVMIFGKNNKESNMEAKENYRCKQLKLALLFFLCLGVGALGLGSLITVTAVLAACGVAIYSSTTQPAPVHDDHHH